MYIAHIYVPSEDGPEERFLGPFSSEEELVDFINNYDVESDYYAKLIPPELFLEETVVVQ